MMLDPAGKLAIAAAGLFFLTGLLTGVWKYLQVRASPRARAHPYVDVAHRSSLMYSFAALLLAVFAGISRLPEMLEFWAAAAPLLFFALAIASYVLHGVLADTTNQLRVPHALGRRTLPAPLMTAFMWTLVAAEIGGFLVLFWGVLLAIA